MNIHQALRITGKPSWPTKMPDMAYGFPTEVCVTGGKLARVPGTVCSVCYAMKGHFLKPVVRDVYARRAAALRHPNWEEAMAVTIGTLAKQPWFRWCDSGDVWEPWVYRKILNVSAALPEINFWLPTQERKIVRSVGLDEIPPNLIVRISDVFPDRTKTKRWPWTSGTTRNVKKVDCPADLRKPRTCPVWCRKCWDREVPHITHALKYGGKK